MMKNYLKFLAAAATLVGASAGASAATAPFEAPEFSGITQWLNSEPLTMKQLRGKVILVDFWTYDCINCINTLSHVVQWHDKYKDKGLVVVGVHTPEYAFERKTENVRTALKRFDIRYPVAQDNRYATWNAYNNRYWPAFYLVNKKGQVVYTHFGEGQYEQTEARIQQLLAQTE
jgi:thiol-disulfide isomerase/thioredoxin